MALMDLLPGRKTEVAVEEPPAPPPVSHQGLLEIGGDFPMAWDTADPSSVEKARRKFRSAVLSGYTAQSYKATKNPTFGGGLGYAGEMTREFDPEADVIRMALPYAGG